MLTKCISLECWRCLGQKWRTCLWSRYCTYRWEHPSGTLSHWSVKWWDLIYMN